MKNRNLRISWLSVLMVLSNTAGLFAQNDGDMLSGSARWLLGTWQATTPKRTTFETWTKVSDTEFAGKSYALNGADTLIFEKVQLISKNGALFYIPTVADQNNGRPVSFRAKAVSATEMTFVNPEHDFPQQITYTHISADSLHAVVSGTVKGTMKSQHFRMRRVGD